MRVKQVIPIVQIRGNQARLKTDTDHLSSKVRLSPLPTLSFFQGVKFTADDVDKLIDTLIKKGDRLMALLKKHSPEMQELICTRIKSSDYKIIIWKRINAMGDQRRLGNQLRGLNKLILDQIQLQLLKLVALQIDILEKEIQQQQIEEEINICLNKKETV